MKHAKRPVAMLLCAPALMCMSYTAGAADATGPAIHFNIPAEDLGAALRDFGQQSNQQILFSTAVVQGKNTAGVTGKIAPEVVLAQLLAGSGLTASRSADGSLLIASADAKGASAAADPSSAPNGARDGQQLGRARTSQSPANEVDEISVLEEIVVTARKREESAQNVPISITALTGADLAERGIERVSDLIGTVPNLTSDGGGSVLGAMGLRGIVAQTRNIGFDSGLGVYIDGVLTVRPNGADQELPDIATVEVLRGPQGTLFGRNTTAGAILLTTRKPNLEKAELEGRVAVGNLGQKEASAYASTPLVDEVLGIKMAGSYAKRDGYLYNTVDGKKHNDTNRKSWRGGVEWKPTDELDISLGGSYLKQNESLVLGQVTAADIVTFPPSAAAYFSDPYTVAFDGPDALERRLWMTNLNINWQLNDYTLTSITAYGDNRTRAAVDNDSTPFPISTSDFRDGAKQFTQELRIASPTSGSFDYLAGIFYLHQKADSYRVTTTFGPPTAPPPSQFLGFITDSSTLATDAYALFGSFNWRLVDKWTLSGGMRYGSEKKSVEFSQSNTTFIPLTGPFSLPNVAVDLSRKDSDVSGNLAISYQAFETGRLYASVARGIKSGGYNPDIVGSADISFEPEKATSYEAGLKSDLLDRRLRINTAVFYTDYKEMQVSSLVGAAFQIRNAGAAKIKGLELEVAAKPASKVELNLGVGYTDAKFTRFPNCFGIESCEDNRLPFVPRWTASAAVQYHQPVGQGSINANLDANYRSSIYYEASNDPTGLMPGYTLVNARLGYLTNVDRSNWGLTLFAKNLFDKRYFDSSFYLAPFNERLVRYAPPRTYGIEATYKY